MTYRHTPKMSEISGFGGGYEACCQTMLEAGVQWLKDHPGVDIAVLESRQVYGVIKEGNPQTEELSRVVIAAAKGEASGAQLHAVMARLAWIAHHGWDKYVQTLEKDHEGP